jgi:bifunctional non-homologous end joining protein LigD
MLWRTDWTFRALPAGFIEPCLATQRAKAPSGPEWFHEIKHDGYRLIARREGKRVRLFTRRGHDWTDCFPWIGSALSSLEISSIVIDGEACISGHDGVTDFAKLHSRSYPQSVFLYAFDVLELNGEDLRKEPLEKRKAKLEKILRKADSGLRFNEHLEGDGATIFRHACKLGLEGIVSKRRDLGYRSGRCKAWVKVKNPNSPAMMRVEDGTF